MYSNQFIDLAKPPFITNGPVYVENKNNSSALRIEPTLPPSSINFTSYLVAFNAMFQGRVIIYHNNQMRIKDTLLTAEQATSYIEEFIPISPFEPWINSDGSFDINSSWTPEKMMHFYEARDENSWFEIRFPRTTEEREQVIKKITIRLFPTIPTNVSISTNSNNLTFSHDDNYNTYSKYSV